MRTEKDVGKAARWARQVLVGAAVCVSSIPVSAQPRPNHSGWSQWGGPTRNFHVDSEPIASVWPEDGPSELWRRPLGEGYSSIVVANEMLVTMYRDGEDEVVIGLDAATGSTRWAHAYHAPLVHNGYFDIWLNSAGPGPYSTPLVLQTGEASAAVVAIGVNGHLHTLDTATGDLLWSHDLVERFALSDYNAFASSPLAYGETVIVPLGGSRQGVVALDRATGAVVWHSDEVALAPGSPLLIRVEGDDQLVVLGQQEVVGLDPRTGVALWTHPHENELGLNISVPVWSGDSFLFVTSAYDGGSRMLQVGEIDGRTTVEEQWSTNRMRVHFSNTVVVDELVIGSSGDFGPAFLTALEIETGAEAWRSREFARAHMLVADGKLVILDEDGDIAIASVSKDGLNVLARHALLTENAWTPPTLVGHTLYVRDRRDILALDLGSQ